ncbi:LON peptidase N-terminal domain and RING finger protein 2-like [Coregonus clupeaformis]|uniref:LON peptidase N-terminal domain and RING finger protein 2-like n=1 Tax=Coregonus clupeaformis TaxID=59861 RepID=UPI001E1C76CA|nr:LON peptidase N-terminal domain and RING finger protein 2-like [Coregonus clupeaformis]
MDTVIQAHQSAQFVHPVYNPGAAGICPEMLEVAEEANRAGDYDLAAEIYSSQLADLQQPDRGLCLRKADALAQTGRIAEALDSYCIAANICELRPGELQLLVENIARTLREKELNINAKSTSCHNRGNGNDRVEADGAFEEEPLDLFSCRLCRCLLSEPTTLECGHTFCKHCLEEETVKDCIQCKHKLNKKDGQILTIGFRVNVILSSLLDKCFDAESKARRHWIEGEVSRKKHDYTDALEKYNKAVELAPSIGRLLGQRAELHMDSRNYSQAIQDAESMCRLKPLWPKAHYIKASALSKANCNDEALKEYFMCVALKPDWTTVKLEAQKVLSELCLRRTVSPLPYIPNRVVPPLASSPPPCSALYTPSPPLRGLAAPHRSDPAFSVSKSSPCEGPSDFSKHHLSPSSEAVKPLLEDVKSLASVLAALPAPPGGLKRRHSGDSPAFNPPSKLPRPDQACSSSHPPATSPGGRMVAADLLDSRDMECSLCMRLFYEPVATPCGHTFCLKCLERCLDHNPNCPLCKENLSEYLATRGYNKTLLMEEVLQRYLGDELVERKKIHEEEMKELSNLNQEVPIFVCTMAFPTIPCPLHVFEPCYRLMIRRSMETGTKQFGMCIADELKGFADYGCMLEVRDVKFFPDGRSVVDTIGVSRFKVLSHGQRDGYNTAKIEYLEDRKVEGQELAELQKLYVSVYDQASGWFTSLKDDMKSQIISHFGHLPGKDPDPQGNPSGPAWAWWLLAVLPLDNRAQLTILAMPSLKDRLIAIRRVLIFVTRKRPR